MKIMEIDEAVYDVCRDWYDSKATPVMHAVAFRTTGDQNLDIGLRALVTEIERCREECTLPDKAESLINACKILRQRIERDEVFLKIVELVDRAKKAGLEESDIAIAFATAWEFE
ncbi:hypothetical protein OIU34_19885 [Pararhizobium sp. BT-229]|uniref:hypothetical protein n=1 Tax=Pararhizobium sp. BT-229 TaxID=2986923 RepID=UPI0021F748B7|nr:hypothetical protein [Pararhizobium sp. BT-229]MCV9964147.1 hypothetical protein [Pararhizobium sp. BT-229]